LSQIGPQWYLAALLALDGLMVLHPVLRRVQLNNDGGWIDYLLQVINASGLLVLPQIVIGGGLATMAIEILLRARVAWALSILLLAAAVAVGLFDPNRNIFVSGYTVVLAVALLYDWRRFDRASIAASSLFALLSIASLLIYAVFGVLYLGAEFSPPIHDLASAIYFSIVSMATVGYGDIVPRTDTARLFTASIIVFGITVFATSISAVIGPVIGGNLRRIVHGGISKVIRKNHFLIVGASPDRAQRLRWAAQAWLLRDGGDPGERAEQLSEDADVVIGDPSDSATLERAAASTAHTVLALRADDSENAFTVLAIRELAPQVRTVALVNDSRNLHRLRLLKPDMLFSPQQLAGELLARTLNNETIDNALVSHLLFGSAQD
jgi:voltage-gated potassium channel